MSLQTQFDDSAFEAPGWVADWLPAGLRAQFLGLEYWQWMGILVLIFLAVAAEFAVRTLTRPILRRVIRRFHAEAEEESIRGTVKALGLFCASLLLLTLFPFLALDGLLRDVGLTAIQVFAVLSGTLIAWRITDLVGDILIHSARRTASKFDDILVPLLRKTAKIFILAFGVIYVAQSLNLNIMPLLTGVGIGGLAFAFAAKDTVENFFGSVAVILDRPFEVGDWVVIGDVEGTVKELGFRSTRILTFYNSEVTIPNSTLVRAQVDNYGRRAYRRWKTYIGVQYDTSPEKLLAFTEGIRELVRRHPFTRKDYYQVWCNDFADSSLNILVYVFHRVPDWSTELRERERLFIDIVRLADRLGVQFAFPTRTVHLYKEQHGGAALQYEIPRGTTDRDALASGARAAREITESQPWRDEPPGPVDFAAGGGSERPAPVGGDE
jgi:MscS family membrane protein